MKTLKFKVINKDRVGLLLDISRILTSKIINVVNLEVIPGIMYFEVESDYPIDKYTLFKELKSIKGVEKCLEIDLLPSKETNLRLQAVLDAISEGVLAINAQAEITIVNPVAEKILKMDKEELIKQKINNILTDNMPMLVCLRDGRPYNHQEILINKGTKQYHYLTSGRPIVDKDSNVTGVVATLKDMTEVRQLVYSVTGPNIITFEDIIGESEKLKEVVQLGEKVAVGNSTILLRGESGTGKELFARAIHQASARRNKPFVPVNCAALPDSLLESELFGYTEGAFTGAQKKGKQGLFEFASEGTIFLDEIGEVSPYLQAKLLRVLQEGKVRRIGSQEEISVDVRVIAATNKNLELMVGKNEFRQDLYYRLNVIPIFLPPLRERKEDIGLLTRYFLVKMNIRFNKKVEMITKDAMKKLYEHDWPGNVRELENVIERAVNLVSGNQLTPDLIIIDGEIKLPAEKSFPAGSLAEILDEVEKQVIKQALNNKGSIRKAARALGVSHTTIMNKIKKHGLTGGKIFYQW